jgi:hypothetical protein
MQCLDTYPHFPDGGPDMPESLIRNLWELKNVTSDLFEMEEKQMMLDMFVKKE